MPRDDARQLFALLGSEGVAMVSESLSSLILRAVTGSS